MYKVIQKRSLITITKHLKNMFIIHTPLEFTTQVEAQRADVQRKIDHYTRMHVLSPSVLTLLTHRVEQRGRAIHGYFRSHYSMLVHLV